MGYATALANHIIARRAHFLKGNGAPDAAIATLVHAEESDLHTLAALPGSLPAKARALAATSFMHEGAGPSAGEWALLRSILAELARAD